MNIQTLHLLLVAALKYLSQLHLKKIDLLLNLADFKLKLLKICFCFDSYDYKLSVKNYLTLKLTLFTGCTKHPGDFKYCKDHKAEETPAVSSSKLNQDNKARLRSAKQKNQFYEEQDFTDSVYIIQGAVFPPILFSLNAFYAEILGTRHSGKGIEYHIKWEDYTETTWLVAHFLLFFHFVLCTAPQVFTVLLMLALNKKKQTSI